MRLLVDVGNSRIKWAWLERGELLAGGAERHDGQLADDVIEMLQRVERRPDEIVVASVAAPAFTTAVTQRVGGALGAPVRLVETAGTACGVHNGYRDPRQLGVDRWLALVGAYSRYRETLCVVDAGTAVTIDALTGAGEHLGGFIVPGAALMRSVLLSETGRLEAAARKIGGADDGDFFGRDTESCIRRGAARSLAALVEASLAKLALGRGTPVLVLTGGDAPALQAMLPHARVHPLLVLEGLAAIVAATASEP